MTPLERFNAWLKEKEPDRFGQSLTTILIKAEELGHSVQDVLIACKEICYWLARNENTKKANKRKWGSFILNWLKPKSNQQTGRLEPSDFGE